MEINDRVIIATDDLGRPIYAPRILFEPKIQTTMEAPLETGDRLPDAWNCGVEPSAYGNTKPAPRMKRRNPGLAFARTIQP